MDTPERNTGRGGALPGFSSLISLTSAKVQPRHRLLHLHAGRDIQQERCDQPCFAHTAQFQTTLQLGNNASPTSTYSESTETAFRLTDRSTLHAVFATPFTAPARKVVVRSDPSLLTCFDPADKELYDLWMPRR